MCSGGHVFINYASMINNCKAFKDSIILPRTSPRQKLIQHQGTVRRDYVTLSIPRELYEKAESTIKGTGFRSVTEYVIFVMRESLMLKAGESVRDRLKALGYID